MPLEQELKHILIPILTRDTIKLKCRIVQKLHHVMVRLCVLLHIGVLGIVKLIILIFSSFQKLNI